MSEIEDPLRLEHAALQREARKQREAFAVSTEGAFAKAMQAAMEEYHRMRAQGVSREDACKGLEAVLREVWPLPTTKFPPTCDTCDDTGWHLKACWHEQRCRRQRCQQAHPAQEHLYAVPCDCAKGERFRARTVAPEDQLAAVGRTQKRKPGGFSRMGT